LNWAVKKLINLSNRSSFKAFYCQCGLKINVLKKRVCRETFDQVVVTAFSDACCGCVAVATNGFVKFLSITTGSCSCHQEAFASQEWNVLLKISANAAREYDESASNV
tara:strand:- start:124 stop:447 length:324 start_codon:yes stop_codon:yes gene_type:complete